MPEGFEAPMTIDLVPPPPKIYRAGYKGRRNYTHIKPKIQTNELQQLPSQSISKYSNAEVTPKSQSVQWAGV